MQCIENKVVGKQFEEIFIKQCHMQGIAVKRKPLSCTWGVGGRLQLLNSELDFEIIFNGITAQIDTKAFRSEKITWSSLTPHQIKTSKWYMDNQVNSGLVVWHTESNNIIFYNANVLSKLQKGESITQLQGEYLGSFEEFCLGNLFSMVRYDKANSQYCDS